MTLMVFIITFITLISLAVSARAWFAKTAVVVKSSAAGSSQSLPLRGPVQVVRFTLYDVGIYPRVAHARKGIVGVAIEDLSGGTMGLMIGLQTGQVLVPVGQVLRQLPQWRGRADFQLQPGQYQVSDASHPANRATLIVDP